MACWQRAPQNGRTVATTITPQMDPPYSSGGDDEEREPADDEGAGDDGQRARSLALSPAASPPLPVATKLFRVAARRDHIDQSY